MKFKLNCSPHLRMQEITKKLFNRNFLSDIWFKVDNKIIYAHSLELMKRSVVFENLLEDTFGEKVLIPITDCKYDHFLQFIRFLYTDECTINDDNGLALLKLAVKYKVGMLENLVINSINTFPWTLKLFEYCVIEKYEIVRKGIFKRCCINFTTLIKRAEFLSLQPEAVNEILGFDKIKGEIKEIEIFNALVGWIDNYCKQHQLSLTEGRQRFEGLIKRIRFPTMSKDELQECATNYPELLNEDDRKTIGNLFTFGNTSNNNSWITTKRNIYKYTYEWRIINRDTTFETKLSVTKDTILHGFWIGIENSIKEFEIEIAEIDVKTNASEKIVFKQSAAPSYSITLLCLGDSLILKPNYVYTIAIKYLGITDDNIEVLYRDEIQPLVYNNPENIIHIMKASGNMLEMVFKPSQE